MSDLMTLEDAAEFLKRPVGTLRNWRYRGEGPVSFKIGRNVVYRRETLEQWLREQEAVSGRGDAVAS